jgi:hypothetical protein
MQLQVAAGALAVDAAWQSRGDLFRGEAEVAGLPKRGQRGAQLARRRV